MEARRALAKELIGIRIAVADKLARMDDLKAALRKLADDTGENFHEEFAGKGRVEVAAAAPAKFKGLRPEVKAGRFLELSAKKRADLLDSGVIIMAEQWGRPYYGAVTVKLF